MNVHPKLNLNAPTFYVDGTEQTQIQDVDIAPASDAEEWKVEPIPSVTITAKVPESFLKAMEAQKQQIKHQLMCKLLSPVLDEEMRESIKKQIALL